MRKTVQVLFGDRIREMREAIGWTQEDLAEHCGMFRTYLSRLETGKANPTLTMIQALADSFGVGIADLFASAPPEVAPRQKTTHRPSRGRITR